MSQTFNDRPFTAREFFKDTWVITGVGCESYLVIGKEKAMMVDTGMSHLNLKEFAQTLSDKPIFVVNTHGHFDHTGGNGFFDEVYTHPYAAGEAKRCFGDPAGYPLDYEIKTFEEGHVFELGDRPIETIFIGAHSPGSVAYLDKNARLLFTGDELECGQVLCMGKAQPGEMRAVEKHLNNMKKLKARVSEFDLICPAHNGTPILPRYIDTFIEMDEAILHGEEGLKQIYSPTWPGFGRENENMRRLQREGTTAIIYDQSDYPLK